MRKLLKNVECRCDCYFSRSCKLEKLPCTSSSIRLHILRALYSVYTHTNYLNNNALPLYPLLFTFERINGFYCLIKNRNLLPPSSELVASCKCKSCSKNQYICVSEKITCCKFC